MEGVVSKDAGIGNDVASASTKEAAEFKLWSINKAASERKIVHVTGTSWAECTTLAEEAGVMLCGRCRVGVSFARGCNSKSACTGTLCRLCSDAGLLCHNHVVSQLPNDF